MKKILRIEGGTIELDIKDNCGCITSTLHTDATEVVEGESEQDTTYDKYNAAIDGIESIILAHALAGINVEDPKYIKGIDTAVIAISNELYPE